jgi:tetratricopeptide (TPR) repeat protein
VGEYAQSQIYYERALAIQQAIGDLRGQVTTLINQGESLRTCGELKKAHENFAQAMTLNQQLQDSYLQCSLLHNLGLLHQDLEEYDDALNYYHASVHLAYSLKREKPSETLSYNLAMILTNLGMLLYLLQCRPEAMAVLLAALDLHLSLHDPPAAKLQQFLAAIEQKIGTQVYEQLRQSALNIQQQVLAYFAEPPLFQHYMR